MLFQILIGLASLSVGVMATAILAYFCVNWHLDEKERKEREHG
jgi:hypothetical protein